MTTREEIAIERQIKNYCDAHPGAPAAVRRPRISKQGGAWVVFLGPNVELGIAGIGPTVEAGLAASDSQYLNRSRPMVA